jgi:hypothetical protein
MRNHPNCDHWIECDRPTCDRDGQQHLTVAGHERPLWLCDDHAEDVRTGQNPEAQR